MFKGIIAVWNLGWSFTMQLAPNRHFASVALWCLLVGWLPAQQVLEISADTTLDPA
jgi:hypothetical protein